MLRNKEITVAIANSTLARDALALNDAFDSWRSFLGF